MEYFGNVPRKKSEMDFRVMLSSRVIMDIGATSATSMVASEV